MEMLSILFLSAIILNVTSMFLAAITAYLYFWLPNVQDSHGICVFHFSLNTALLQAYMFTTGIIMSKFGLRGKYDCMIEMNIEIFLVTAVCVWSVMLSYNTWKEVKQIQDVNQTYPTRRLNCYRSLGYGVPILYVALILLFYEPLIIHQIKFCFSYTSFLRRPTFGSIFLNVFFFVDLQRRLWNISRVQEVQNENPSSRSSTNMVALKYRMCLNLKLCLTMSIPFGLSSIIFMILAYTADRNSSNKKFVQELFGTLFYFIQSLQGTLIFLAAVAFRKRVIKSFIRYGNQSCLRFVRIPECLRSPANDDSVEETDDNTGTYPEEERGISLSPMASLTNEN